MQHGQLIRFPLGEGVHDIEGEIEAVRILEGDLSPKISIDNLEENNGLKKFWDDFEQTTNQYVDSVTLEDIAQNDNSYSEADYIYYIFIFLKASYIFFISNKFVYFSPFKV